MEQAQYLAVWFLWFLLFECGKLFAAQASYRRLDAECAELQAEVAALEQLQQRAERRIRGL